MSRATLFYFLSFFLMSNRIPQERRKNRSFMSILGQKNFNIVKERTVRFIIQYANNTELVLIFIMKATVHI